MIANRGYEMQRIGCQVRYMSDGFGLVNHNSSIVLHHLGLSYVRWTRKTIQLYLPEYDAVSAENAHLRSLVYG